MKLYHGSNVAVPHPKILNSDRRLDFGTGFYTTSDFEQAKRWAEITTNRREDGIPTVTVFEFTEDCYKNLAVKIFDAPNEEWLKYASANRIGDVPAVDYDIVIGPVANDKTAPVIKFYFTGIYDEEETIKRLMPQKLKDQYVFKTEKALSYLVFSEVVKNG